jgi:hypothetical protein
MAERLANIDVEARCPNSSSAQLLKSLLKLVLSFFGQSGFVKPKA